MPAKKKVPSVKPDATAVGKKETLEERLEKVRAFNRQIKTPKEAGPGWGAPVEGYEWDDRRDPETDLPISSSGEDVWYGHASKYPKGKGVSDDIKARLKDREDWMKKMFR